MVDLRISISSFLTLPHSKLLLLTVLYVLPVPGHLHTRSAKSHSMTCDFIAASRIMRSLSALIAVLSVKFTQFEQNFSAKRGNAESWAWGLDPGFFYGSVL